MAKTASKTESGILSTVHKSAAGLCRAGVIDKATMREFDALCLTPVTSMAPEEINALRSVNRFLSRCSPPAHKRITIVDRPDLSINSGW